MKKLLFLSVITTMFFASCSSDDGGAPLPPDNVFEVEGSVCDVVHNNDATATIIMKNAKFAERMPAMDIILPHVPVYASGEELLLMSAEVVPEVEFGGVVGPYEAYTINDFSGEITADASLSFQCYMHLGKIAFHGVPEGDGYKGVTTVTSPEGDAPADVPAVIVKEFPGTNSVAELGDGSALTVTLNNVSFAQNMSPMNIRIPGIAYVAEGSYYSAVIVPEFSKMGSAYSKTEAYTMNSVKCTIAGNEICMTLSFPMGYLRYTATAVDGVYTGIMTFTNKQE